MGRPVCAMSPNAAGIMRPPVPLGGGAGLLPPYCRFVFTSICVDEPASITVIAAPVEEPCSVKACRPSGVRSFRDTSATQYAPVSGTVNVKKLPLASAFFVSSWPLVVKSISADQRRHVVQGLAARAVAIWEKVLEAARPRGAPATPPPLAFRGAGGGAAGVVGAPASPRPLAIRGAGDGPTATGKRPVAERSNTREISIGMRMSTS